MIEYRLTMAIALRMKPSWRALSVIGTVNIDMLLCIFQLVSITRFTAAEGDISEGN